MRDFLFVLALVLTQEKDFRQGFFRLGSIDILGQLRPPAQREKGKNKSWKQGFKKPFHDNCF
ncbi:MAG: hypothetical protein D6765_06010 [Bacteroidetes bacterium]|nr:MAG: hypothetical protein D6765_06010 [Bacteroidota bacterium]